MKQLLGGRSILETSCCFGPRSHGNFTCCRTPRTSEASILRMMTSATRNELGLLCCPARALARPKPAELRGLQWEAQNPALSQCISDHMSHTTNLRRLHDDGGYSLFALCGRQTRPEVAGFTRTSELSMPSPRGRADSRCIHTLAAVSIGISR